MLLKGVYPALVTPFGPNAEVDYRALENLIDFVIAGGVSGIVPCGSTGEFYALNDAERSDVLRFVKEVTKGRVQLIAGANAGSTRDVIRFSHFAKELGYDGVMLAPPYYSLPTQPELLAHFRAAADAVDIPIVLYNYPARTGVEIGFEVLDGLVETSNIIGIKEASGDMARVYQMKLRYGDRYQISCGCDAQALDYFLWGAQSWIGGGSNVCPREHVALLETATRGDLAGARAIMMRLLPLLDNMESGKYTQKAKYGCALAGVPSGDVRGPLLPLNADERENFRRLFEIAVSA